MASSAFACSTHVAVTDFTMSIHRQRKKADYYPRPAATFETHTYTLGSGRGYKQDDTAGAGDPWVSVTGGKETPLDRFRRLRFEMEELEAELKQEHEQRDQADTPSDLLDQLGSLRSQMSELQVARNAQEGVGREWWGSEARRLLESLQSTGSLQSTPKGDEVTGEQSKSLARPMESQETQIEAFDERLVQLEELVGIRDALHDETKSIPRPLLSSLARIDHLLTLLTQPRHLDGISRRIKVLMSELERVQEAKRRLATNEDTGQADGSPTPSSAAVPPETLKRLDNAMDLMSKVEPMLPIVPAILTRLQSLATLHADSASFATTVDTLERLAQQSQTQSKDLASMLQSLEGTFAENQQRVTSNLKVVEDRMERIMERMDALGA